MALIRTFDDLNQIARPRYLLRPMIELGSIGMLFGPSGLGKTFVSLDMALAVASGQPWAGMHTTPMPVVYVSAEGGDALGRRVRAWYLDMAVRLDTDEERQHLIAQLTDNFFVVPHAVQVVSPEARADLVQSIRAATSDRIGLVVLDTVARNAVDLEENSARDMGRFVDGCAALRGSLKVAGEDEDDNGEPTVMLVHHTGKQTAVQHGADPVERGSSALKAALDFSLALDAGPPLRLLTVKLKDAAQPAPMAVTWSEPVQVGYDFDLAEPIKSIVARVEPAGTATSPAEDKAEKRRAEVAKLDHAIMAEMERAPDLSIRDIALNLDESRSKIARRVKWMVDQGQVTRRDRRYVTSLPEFVPIALGGETTRETRR